MPRFHHVALIGKYQTTVSGTTASSSREVMEEIAHFLERQGCEVSLEAETAANTGMTHYNVLDADAIGARCDLGLVVGGDGTMLGIGRQLARYGVPLVGINQGRLGFITDVPVGHYREALGSLVAGDYEEEHRSMIEGGVWRDGEKIFDGLSLNEVVVSRGATAGMVELKIDIGDEFVANQRADGLIIASPTGSTAYALSAGGPILHPGVAGWLIVPIAPHMLSNRPIVVPDNGRISVEIVSAREPSVNFDMQSLASLLIGDRITVRRSDHRVRFLHPRGWNYYATLRRKLHWNEGALPGDGGQ